MEDKQEKCVHLSTIKRWAYLLIMGGTIGLLAYVALCNGLYVPPSPEPEHTNCTLTQSGKSGDCGGSDIVQNANISVIKPTPAEAPLWIPLLANYPGV